MQLCSDVQIPDGLLAEMALLSEKPRLGFRARKCTVHQGLEAAKYLNRIGDTTTVVRYSWQMSLKAQQQKYDPSKSGPEDPTNPGHPLYKNSVVKKASDKAFMQTMDGQAGNGLAESGFAIALKNGKIVTESWTTSVNGSGKLNQLSIDTSDPDIIAILHTHGNNALPTPSPGDRNPNVQFPDFVRSRSALYVTVPHSASGSPPLNQYIELQ